MRNAQKEWCRQRKVGRLQISVPCGYPCSFWHLSKRAFTKTNEGGGCPVSKYTLPLALKHPAPPTCWFFAMHVAVSHHTCLRNSRKFPGTCSRPLNVEGLFSPVTVPQLTTSQRHTFPFDLHGVVYAVLLRQESSELDKAVANASGGSGVTMDRWVPIRFRKGHHSSFLEWVTAIAIIILFFLCFRCCVAVYWFHAQARPVEPVATDTVLTFQYRHCTASGTREREREKYSSSLFFLSLNKTT